MNNSKAKFSSIDEYIATFPEDTQALLETVRATIKAAAPDAEEKISYGMPAFAQKGKGNLVYFAKNKDFIGLYPASSGVPQAFKDELSRYKCTPGSIHLPISEPLPLDLITRIVRYRLAETEADAEAKKTSKKKS